MAHHLALAEHFCEHELFRCYRDCTDPTERTHWQVIWLKSQGRSTPEIASVVGYSENWIRYGQDCRLLVLFGSSSEILRPASAALKGSLKRLASTLGAPILIGC